MSRIDDLIAELCPDGVENKTIGSVCRLFAGGDVPKDRLSNEKTANYSIPIYSNGIGDNALYGWTDNSKIDAPCVTVSARGTIGYCTLREEPFFPVVRLICAIPTDLLNVRFLKYAMELLHFQVPTSGIPQLTVPMLAKYKLPIPPLSVQQEIVRILDTFTTLEVELEAELGEELEARKKQYEYYKDGLFTFGDDVRWQTLESVIISLKTGLNPRQNFRLNTDDATNYYVTVRELTGKTIRVSEKTDKVNDDALRLINNRSNLEVNDVLFSGTGTVGRTALVQDVPDNWNIKEGVYVIKPDTSRVLPLYLLYLLGSNVTRERYKSKIVGSPVISLPMGELKKLLIPIPPLAAQERIVAILGRFDALVNDLTQALPAEIKARRKQYEYYRDNLLTFKEKVS